MNWRHPHPLAAIAIAVFGLALTAAVTLAAPLAHPPAGTVAPADSPDFADVPTSSPFYGYLHNLTLQGIVSGYTCGGSGEPCIPPANLPYYRPGAPVTRLQMTKFIDGARHQPGIVISTTDPAPLVISTTQGTGLAVHNVSGDAIVGESVTPGNGIVGLADAGGSGVLGISNSGAGVTGNSTTGDGVYGSSTSGYAGNFQGNVHITGTCCAAVAGTYQIDDPRDPANSYLNQAAVESPEWKTVYDGNVTTDAAGEATVVLPAYAQALDRDFRYQLTVVGQFAQAIVARKIEANRFIIKTDKPNVEVSWQVTGIRNDPWARDHAAPAEAPKPTGARGTYIYPQGAGSSPAPAAAPGK